ncbi:hypothetical protein KL920_004698 [Ogataea angusta]|nr:hypothetical protein KL920_004698 [Ogataea angusta]
MRSYKIVVNELKLGDIALCIPGSRCQSSTEQKTQLLAVDQIRQMRSVTQRGAFFVVAGNNQIQKRKTKKPDQVRCPALGVDESFLGELLPQQASDRVDLQTAPLDDVPLIAGRIEKKNHQGQAKGQNQGPGNPKEVFVDGNWVEHSKG